MAPIKASMWRHGSPRSESYLLSLPSQAMSRKAFPGVERELEAIGDLALNKDGGAFVAFVGVLVVNGGMMLLRVVATFENGGDQLA